MDAPRERRGALALRAYVAGETSEPIVLSAFRDVPPGERSAIVSRHRGELQAIDDARLLILESMLVPWKDRAR
ncbi:MAG TPA: hypothetical protein VM370_05585 [Candidatus Thermoplasmatota archaeon]|nr:hypothetical protein [Candidatus Thermoplasmatota archaeon]